MLDWMYYDFFYRVTFFIIIFWYLNHISNLPISCLWCLFIIPSTMCIPNRSSVRAFPNYNLAILACSWKNDIKIKRSLITPINISLIKIKILAESSRNVINRKNIYLLIFRLHFFQLNIIISKFYLLYIIWNYY